MLFLASCCFHAASMAKPSLRDIPVIGNTLKYLDSNDWTASSRGLTIPATVPGDIVSDLYREQKIGNPLYELNWLNSSLWANRDWTYTKTFSYTVGPAQAGEVLLVLDGVKMGSTVTLNGIVLGRTLDQFLRYSYPALDALKESSNHHTLEISFPRETPLNCDGRWMGCTGGWDWAPYTDTFQEGQVHTFTYGIWKSVYLVGVEQAAITNVVPHTYYQGGYPTAPLTDSSHGGFTVEVRVHIWAPAAGKGVLTVHGGWHAAAANTTAAFSWPAGDSNKTVVLKADPAAGDTVELWWPAGSGFPVTDSSPYGARPTLYNVSVTLNAEATTDADASTTNLPPSPPSQPSPTPSPSSVVLMTSRMIGFRHVALVTINDTDPALVKQAETEEGSGVHGMLLRVNGAVMFARGASMIPMEEMEGWMNADAHVEAVVSAAEGKFNMLRAWGGGIWFPTVWYEVCDLLGIMIYHDMQYAQNGHAPLATPTQEAELRHQVRRLSHHPSIAMWDGCNECAVIMNTSTEIYATFVLAVVASEDHSRSVWPSCPSHGWASGVDKLTSRPVPGEPLVTPDKVGVVRPLLETHRPKWRADGFPSVNGKSGLDPQPNQFMCVPALGPCNWQGLFQSNIPLNLTQQEVGPGQPNVFSSESPGASVMSSYESMTPTLDEKHWGIHGGAAWDTCDGNAQGNAHCTAGNNVMAQRNYPCDNYIAVYWGMAAAMNLNATGEQAFKQQLYMCMIAQALIVKQNIELTRATPRFGILVWQFNEIWPTGGWGSVEYGNPTFPGQVIGGRWKPLQYWFRKSLYADVFATCDSTKGLCYVKNDAPRPFVGQLLLNVTSFATGEMSTIVSQNVSLAAGAGAIQWIEIPEVAALDGTTNYLEAIVAVASGSTTVVVMRNPVMLVTPEKLQLKPANTVVTAVKSDADGRLYANISCDAVAMFVTLTTLAHGRFEDNGMVVHPPGQLVEFIPSPLAPEKSKDVAWKQFQNSLRVEDASYYPSPPPLPPPPSPPSPPGRLLQT